MAKAEYRSAIRSRTLIKGALADLLQEKPLEKITVTDVVNRAGINRGTFYAHYSDVPDVINRVIQQTFAGIREALSPRILPLEDVPGAIMNSIQSILESDLDFYKKIMNSTAAPMLQEQMINLVLEYLMARETAYHVANQDPCFLTIRFCAGGLSNLYRDWFTGKIPIPLPELTAQSEAFLRKTLAGLPSA